MGSCDFFSLYCGKPVVMTNYVNVKYKMKKRGIKILYDIVHEWKHALPISSHYRVHAVLNT